MADSSEEIRVFIAHPDSDAFAEIDEALVDVRTVRIVGTATDAAQTVKALSGLKPDVLVIDGDAAALSPMELLEDIFVKDLPVGGIILWEVQDNERIRSAMRAGAEDFLIKPVTPEALLTSVNNAYSIVRAKFPQGWEQPIEAPTPSLAGAASAGEAGGKVVGICSGKAGVGKTTLTTNLAVALAKHQKAKTVLVDLDHADAAILLNLRPTRGLVDLTAQMGDLDQDMLNSCLAHHDTGVVLLPGAVQATVEDIEVISPELLKNVMNLLRATHEFVLIIFPVLRGDEHLKLLGLCDEVYCVAVAHNLIELKSTKNFLDTIVNKFVDDENMKVILNQYSHEGFVSLEDVEKTLHRKVNATLPEAEKLVTDSINMGVPFVVKDAKSPTSECLIHLAAVLNGQADEATPAQEKHGWWPFGKKH